MSYMCKTDVIYIEPQFLNDRNPQTQHLYAFLVFELGK